MKIRRLKDFPGYAVSRDGRVWSCKGYHNNCVPWHSLKLRTDKAGYAFIGLWKDRKQVFRKVHRLVWDTFHGHPPVGLEINHIDGDKQNSSLSNLELVTHLENMQHAHRNGLIKNRARGHRVHTCKLTEEQVLAIRQEYATGKTSMVHLARKYFTYPSNICDIVHRKTWKHI